MPHKHRADIDLGFLTKHKLKLINLTTENSANIHTAIDKLNGVDSVETNIERKTIKIAYDASKHNIDEFLVIIKSFGAEASPDWWNQYKLSWDRQVDQNIQDNFKHQPVCCNKKPTGRRSTG